MPLIVMTYFYGHVTCGLPIADIAGSGARSTYTGVTLLETPMTTNNTILYKTVDL